MTCRIRRAGRTVLGMPEKPETCRAPACENEAPYYFHDKYVCIGHIIWAAQQPATDPVEQVKLAPGWREVHE